MRQYEKGRREGQEGRTGEEGREGGRVEIKRKVGGLCTQPAPRVPQITLGGEVVAATRARVLAMEVANRVPNPIWVGAKNSSELRTPLTGCGFVVLHVRN